MSQPDLSHYIRTTCMLSSQAVLQFADGSRIRFLSADEANSLAQQIQRRNVFARHSRENDFYVQRAKALADHTVVEVFRPGDPDDMEEDAEQRAMILERVAVLSSTIALDKQRLQRRLGISTRPQTETDFIAGPQLRFLSSRRRAVPDVQGITIDSRFCTRFSRCGFLELADYLQSKAGMAGRVSVCLEWLFDSRTEPRLEASVVKSSIALESLLILHESESLAQSLSERAALLLSTDPSRRRQISRVLKRFYEARSGIVHGNQKKAKKLTPSLLEAIDRIVVLLCLIISSNAQLWSSDTALREWCEDRRWGEPLTPIKIPFRDSYLRHALALRQ